MGGVYFSFAYINRGFLMGMAVTRHKNTRKTEVMSNKENCAWQCEQARA